MCQKEEALPLSFQALTNRQIIILGTLEENGFRGYLFNELVYKVNVGCEN